jgi:trehalose 6-phosphate synthase/phosphatase
LVTGLLMKYNCRPVFLTQRQVNTYYNGYSNSILWPLFHSLPTESSHINSRWKSYIDVNQLFCEAVLTLTGPNSTIWVHDYQLMLLPELLRQQRPEDKIGFFLHIPFPPAKDFMKHNHADKLLHGVLGADLIGFHTKDYVQHFLDTCYDLTSATPIHGGIALKNRAVRVATFPMGIDYVKFSHAVRAKSVLLLVRKYRLRYFGKKVILTVDRLDPTKGFIERLVAYREFLRTSPAMHGKVILLMLAVPSRGDIEAYKQLKKTIETNVSSINKEFGSNLWKPVEYRYESVSFDELNALYQIADVAFVAPLRDGMNLVAKEYIASQGRKKGILILSQTAGASKELQDALLVDHNKPNTLVKALKRAVIMPPKELNRRVAKMQKTLSLNTVFDWAGNFMVSLNKSFEIAKTPMLTSLRRDNLVRNIKGAQNRLLIFDYDGVLAAFKDRPEDAYPTPDLLNTLRYLAAQKLTTVAIVSGRSKADLDKWFRDLPIFLSAEHGATFKYGSKNWQQAYSSSLSWKKTLRPVLEKHAADTPGAFVEEKDFSLVWHYRSASVYFAQKNIAILKSALKPILKQFGIKMFMGNKILEIKDPRINKGLAVSELLNKPYDFILAMGDDFTDEDMFKVLPKRAITIKVGPGKTSARYRVNNVSQVLELLNNL